MNTIGTLFRVTTWGESHGKALGAIVDGCPPGLIVDVEAIQSALDRRKPGPWKPGSTSRHEEDKVEILSGVFEGKTLGTPISMLIWNKDAKSKDYAELKETHRPGHADFTYKAKYGLRDHRGGGRASGRETAARVMAGSIAKLMLPELKVSSQIKQIGSVSGEDFNGEMQMAIEATQAEGDSLGGIVQIRIENIPAGLGSPVFGKLEAELSKALMSVGAVKAVEFGEGFKAASMKGSEHNEASTGGIAGGISDGTPLIARVAIKPPSSIAKTVKGRHDACIVPRIPVILESMVLIVLADETLKQRAIRPSK